jgi:hypothetical protein
VGIAVNGGTDVAQEAAHVALREGGLGKIPVAIDIAREGVQLISAELGHCGHAEHHSPRAGACWCVGSHWRHVDQ